jgi:hypothetical protein
MCGAKKGGNGDDDKAWEPEHQILDELLEI